ncbi:hypothetical protein EC988_008664, partial [Linderina pennispora]
SCHDQHPGHHDKRTRPPTGAQHAANAQDPAIWYIYARWCVSNSDAARSSRQSEYCIATQRRWHESSSTCSGYVARDTERHKNLHSVGCHRIPVPLSPGYCYGTRIDKSATPTRGAYCAGDHDCCS